MERNICGRFGLFEDLDALAERFNFDPWIMRDIDVGTLLALTNCPAGAF